MLSETVTKTSEERQELHPFLIICVSPYSFPTIEADRLNVTYKKYKYGQRWATKFLTEEEVYDTISVELEDLLSMIVIEKTAAKNSENYEKVTIRNMKDLKKSGVIVQQEDYYSVLKIWCLKF